MSFTLIDYKSNQYTWHVQDKKPAIQPRLANMPVARSLYADGHELQLIESRFKNLPIRRFDQPTIWYGEMAQFIYDNLP